MKTLVYGMLAVGLALMAGALALHGESTAEGVSDTVMSDRYVANR